LTTSLFVHGHNNPLTVTTVIDSTIFFLTLHMKLVPLIPIAAKTTRPEALDIRPGPDPGLSSLMLLLIGRTGQVARVSCRVFFP
jgi:hypothetical protein